MTSQITEHEQHETEQNLSYVESLWDEAQSSFEMLDKKQEGVLNLHDARHWLRCLGWCDSDKELDDILLRGLENGSKKKKFSLVQLRAIADIESEDKDFDSLGKKLDSLLSFISEGKRTLPRATLRTLLTSVGEPIAAEDFEELLDLLPLLGSKDVLDVPKLGAQIMAKIETPPCVPTHRSMFV